MKNSAIKKLLTSAALLLWVAMLPACNTVQGAGKDIQKAGEKVEETAK